MDTLMEFSIQGDIFFFYDTLSEVNTARISNFFVEIRVVSYLKSLAIQGFPLLYV